MFVASGAPARFTSPCQRLRPEGLRGDGGGGGSAVSGSPASEKTSIPPVRDSYLSTGPHRHASKLTSNRFAGRHTPESIRGDGGGETWFEIRTSGLRVF